MTPYEQLFELLAHARDNGYNVTLHVHDVPLAHAAQWLVEGALDALEPGAGGNPITGRVGNRALTEPRVEAAVFTTYR